MKKLSIIVMLLLLVPSLAFAAPKVKITFASLKKQVSVLVIENKALKAEIEALKATNTKLVADVTYCKANPQKIVERVTTQQLVPYPVTNVVYSGETQPPAKTRKMKLHVSPITDGVEVGGVETVTGVKLQVQEYELTDSVELVDRVATNTYTLSGTKVFEFTPESSTFLIRVNGSSFTVNIVVENTPDKDRNANKRVYLTGVTDINV